MACVGETFSVPMLTASARAASHPLSRALLSRIARDEAPHAELGWLYLDWVAPQLDDAERRRLARAALAAVAELTAEWQQLGSTVVDGVTSEGFELAHVHELGFVDSQSYAELARRTLHERIAAPLAMRGIVLPAAELAGTQTTATE